MVGVLPLLLNALLISSRASAVAVSGSAQTPAAATSLTTPPTPTSSPAPIPVVDADHDDKQHAQVVPSSEVTASRDVLQRDMDLILGKYRNAAERLRGVGLVALPELNITTDYDALANATHGMLPLTAHGRDLEYYGNIAVGTAPQKLNVIVDTGSADLWLKSNCRSCNGPQYKPSSSRSYRNTGQPFSIQYGSGAAQGTLARDTVTIGGLTVANQSFGAVTATSSEFNSDAPVSGLIGMAFSSIASSRQPTWFENLIRTKPTVGSLFSVFLTRGQPSGSELCIGCYDARRTRDGVVWLPVVSKTYWTVSMRGATINDSLVVSPTELAAAIDTGTTLIYLPDAFVKRFYAKIAGAQLTSSGYWGVPCSAINSLTISLLFGSTKFDINPVDFNLGQLGGGLCAGAINSLGGSFPDNLAIIGVAFLKSWYSTYDYAQGGRVGLSRSTNW